jgi:hypothetical protein
MYKIEELERCKKVRVQICRRKKKYLHLTSRAICWLLPFPMELPTSHMYSPDCDLVEGGGGLFSKGNNKLLEYTLEGERCS